MSRHQDGPEEDELSDVVPEPELNHLLGLQDEPEVRPGRAGDEVEQPAGVLQPDPPLSPSGLHSQVEPVLGRVHGLDLQPVEQPLDDVPAGHQLVHHDGGVGHLVGQTGRVCEHFYQAVVGVGGPRGGTGGRQGLP